VYNGVEEIELPADVSSQYISALMLIAPYLPNGLKIKLTGEIVSLPYLMMTKNLISFFGGDVGFEEDTFTLRPSTYTAKTFQVEGDWSAASYYYAVVAFEQKGFQLELEGIHQDSLQGDHVMTEIGRHFGVETSFDNSMATLSKISDVEKGRFHYDFMLCQALRVELAKIAVKVDDHGQEDNFTQEGKFDLSKTPSFDTYEDHRMAMALASLAIYDTIQINEPNVVNKSYPEFWNDLKKIGFIVR
jgi:3-phosphoshikimate 1-carboxyvinyltransferase